MKYEFSKYTIFVYDCNYKLLQTKTQFRKGNFIKRSYKYSFYDFLYFKYFHQQDGLTKGQSFYLANFHPNKYLQITVEFPQVKIQMERAGSISVKFYKTPLPTFCYPSKNVHPMIPAGAYWQGQMPCVSKILCR